MMTNATHQLPTVGSKDDGTEEYVQRLKAIKRGSYYRHLDSMEREMIRAGEVRVNGKWEFTLMQLGHQALEYYSK